MPPIIDKTKCIACQTCVDICPTDVFFDSKPEEIPLARYPDECWHCNACVHDCPEGAIRLRIPLPLLVVYK
jgi:adenylylsulfate reductase subunit B